MATYMLLVVIFCGGFTSTVTTVPHLPLHTCDQMGDFIQKNTRQSTYTCVPELLNKQELK